MLVASGIYVLGRWSHNEPAITLGAVAGIVFLIVTLGLLDHGTTEPVAKGFAWIILAVALLSDNSPLLPLTKLFTSKLSNKPITPGS